jgi:hypothetical protein
LHGTAAVWDETSFQVNAYENGKRKGYGRRYAVTDPLSKVWNVASEGIWDEVMHGQGRMVQACGDIFEGEFHKGSMKQGIVIKPNGEVKAYKA